MQTGHGTRTASSGLDQIAELVDQPQPPATQLLVGRGPAPSQRIGDLAGVRYLADDPVAGAPQTHCPPAAGVAYGVAGELVGGEDQVSYARFGEPGTLGPAGDEPAYRTQVVTVARAPPG